MDYIMNGAGHGPVASALQEVNFDTGLYRPYIDGNGQKCVTINTGKQLYNEKTKRFEPVYENVRIKDLIANSDVDSPVLNATSLRKDEWIKMDDRVISVARQRMRAWADLAASSSYGGFDGFSTMLLEHETISDPGEALVDMDALTEGRTDSPLMQLEGLPLPITHSSFSFAKRRLMISRKGSTPLDFRMAEAASRRVAETIEKTTIGVATGMTYGRTADYGRAPTVYGYLNFPDRIIKSDMVAPTGTNGPAVLSSWLALREDLYDNNHYGPYMVYVSGDWDQYLDNLFSTTEPSAGTLRKRLLEIDSVRDIRRLDYLTGPFTVLMVEMTSEVARAVTGMNITVIQWESNGGMRLNFKVMCIMVPQLFADYEGQCGIAHGTPA